MLKVKLKNGTVIIGTVKEIRELFNLEGLGEFQGNQKPIKQKKAKRPAPWTTKQRQQLWLMYVDDTPMPTICQTLRRSREEIKRELSNITGAML